MSKKITDSETIEPNSFYMCFPNMPGYLYIALIDRVQLPNLGVNSQINSDLHDRFSTLGLVNQEQARLFNAEGRRRHSNRNIDTNTIYAEDTYQLQFKIRGYIYSALIDRASVSFRTRGLQLVWELQQSYLNLGVISQVQIDSFNHHN